MSAGYQGGKTAQMAETYQKQWQGNEEQIQEGLEVVMKDKWQEVQAENPQEAMEWDRKSAPLLDGGQGKRRRRRDRGRHGRRRPKGGFTSPILLVGPNGDNV